MSLNYPKTSLPAERASRRKAGARALALEALARLLARAAAREASLSRSDLPENPGSISRHPGSGESVQ
jgi:hypothetical protein